jgi:hypothetical protein
MNQFEGLMLLAGLSLGLVLAGYWLGSFLEAADPAIRLAFAPLAGLGCMLLGVSAVNFFMPLSTGWSLLCLAPIVVTLALPRSRKLLAQDLGWLRRERGAAGLAVLGAAFLAVILWPMLSDGQCVYYDGTSNHDSFFWISGAEHLKRHTYMVAAAPNATQPLTNGVFAFTGWRPIWGRMGAEGMLALVSSLSWTSPLKVYLYGTACLFLPWAAALFLAVRTFYAERLPWVTRAALLVIQPVFVFYYSNANLPNLLGALMGAAAVVATAQILQPAGGSARAAIAWWGLLVLSLHGLACTYPEMVPFVLLPCGLLWLRRWFLRNAGAARPCAGVAAAVVASAGLNPATTIRALYGFHASYLAGRANQNWSNIFEAVRPADFFPAFTTLSVTATVEIEAWLGMLLTAVLVAALALAWWRARDRFGAVAAFAGSIALAAYTAATGFNYGWQKTAQFAGVFLAAAVPVAIFDALGSAGGASVLRRTLARAGLVLAGGFLGFALVMNCRELFKTSQRKVISQDWFRLREQSQTTLHDAPVLVDSATFRMGFFYSMWSAYFLPESRLYFGVRGDEGGGYLRSGIIREGAQPIPPPRAILAGRAWADAFDADSPRLLVGREYAVLERSNRVLALQGVHPLYGLPEYSSNRMEMEIVPHSPASLSFDLNPRERADRVPGTWRIERKADGVGDFSAAVSGPPPWRIKIPLVAGRSNRVTAAFSPGIKGTEPYPFILGGLRVENQP